MASARTLLEEKREEILRLAALHGAVNPALEAHVLSLLSES